MPNAVKTKPTPEKQRCVLKFLSQDSDLNYNVRIEVLRSGWNRNNWNYQNIEQHYKSFLGTPILCAFPRGQIGDGHNMAEARLPNGDVYYDFTGANAERIVGAVGDKESDIWTESRNGETWICANGKVWRFYNRQLVDHLAEQGGMEVSAETEVFEEYEEKGKGTVFTSWRGLGVTILNEKVAPAVPGANIKALKAISEEKWKMTKLAVASYGSNSGSDAPKTNQIGSDTPTKNEEGVKRKLNTLNKKQLAELNKKFSGYVLLAAIQNDDGSTNVKMRNDKFEYSSYLMQTADETIVPEKFAALSVHLDMGDGITAEVDEIYDEQAAQIVTLNAEKESLENELSEAKKTIAAMQEAEKKRRVNAAKEAANTALNDFNANRVEKVSAKEIEKVTSDIEKGVYNNCMDANGEWNGCETVKTAVLAICAMNDIAVQKKKADKSRDVFVFGNNDTHAIPDDDGSVGALLRQIGIAD